MPPEDEVLDLADDSAELAAELGFKPVEERGEVLPKSVPDEEIPEVIPGIPPAPSVKSEEKPRPDKAPAESTPSAENTAPGTWRKEAAAEWQKIHPTVQAEIRKRENDMMQGIEQYKQAAAVGHSFHQAVSPYIETLQRFGLNPALHARNLFEVHKQLALGTPEVKAQTIRQLMRDFAISPDDLVASKKEPAYVDPAVQSLQSQLKELQSGYSQIQSTQLEGVKSQILREIEEFTKAPGHELFGDVENDIAALLQSKACTTLQEAYDTAVARNPLARQKLFDKIQQDRSELDRKAKEARAQQVRRSTAANVRTSAKSKSTAAPKGSMDDTMREVAARLYGE